MSSLQQRVLVVEDNEDDYVIVRDLLTDITSAKVEFEWVKTYAAAYAALTQGDYDVCLLDYHLGAQTGLELLEALPADNLTPVILLTGTEDHRIDVAAATAGASDYLVKGHVNTPLLERSIRYAIQRKESETAFLQAQRFAQATVDALPDHIAVLDEQGTIVAVNAAWRDFAETNGFMGATYGISDSYLTVCDTSGTAEARAVATGIRAVMAGQLELFSLEYPCHSPDEQRWFKMRATRFAGGGPLHVVVAHENITERKLAATRLLESEANLANAQQMAHLGSWEWELTPHEDWSKNRVCWSDETCRIFGYAPGEIEPSYDNFIRLVHPDDLSRIEDMASQALRDGTCYSHDHRLILPDGSERIVHQQAETIFDAAGKPLRMVGTVQDITERQQAAARLRQSEANLARAQQIAHLGSWELDLLNLDDPNDNPLRWSDEVFRIFGYEPGQIEVSSENFFRAVHPADRERIRALLTEAVHEGKTYQTDHRILLPDGVERIVHEQSEIVFDERTGKPLKMVGTVQDITERKQAEARQSALLHGLNTVVTMADELLALPDLDALLRRAVELARARLGLERCSIFLLRPEADEMQGTYGTDIHGHTSDERHCCVTLHEHWIAPHLSGDFNQPAGSRWFVDEQRELVSIDANNKDKSLRQLGKTGWIAATPIFAAHGPTGVLFNDTALTNAPLNDITQELVVIYCSLLGNIIERKQAEDALRSSEARFQSIVANVPGMVYQFVKWPDGSIAWPFVSEGCQAIFEATPEAIKSNPDLPFDMVHPADRSELDRSVAFAKENLMPWSWEGRIRTVAGKTKWLRGASHPQRLPAGGTICTGLFMDLTARKEAEAERDRFFTMSLDIWASPDWMAISSV